MKSTLNIHWKDWWYSLKDWNSNTLATWCNELTHWKRPWCWERLKAGGEGGDRGWDGWMASLTQWHEFEQTLGDNEVQGSVEVQGSPWGHKKSDSTEGLTQQLAFISDNIHLPWHKIHIKYMNLFIHLLIYFYLKFYGFILDTCATVYYSFFRNKFVVLNMHQSS